MPGCLSEFTMTDFSGTETPEFDEKTFLQCLLKEKADTVTLKTYNAADSPEDASCKEYDITAQIYRYSNFETICSLFSDLLSENRIPYHMTAKITLHRLIITWNNGWYIEKEENTNG